MSYLKTLSCKHHNENDAVGVFSNGFLVGNSFDEYQTRILVETFQKCSSANFSYNTIENSIPLYLGIAGNFAVSDVLFDSEITGYKTTLSGSVNPNQGVVTNLKKNAPLHGFSNNSSASINFKYEAPTLASTAVWSNITAYIEGQYVKIGGELFVALEDNTDKNPTTTAGFWVAVLEESFIYEIVHNWTFRPYMPESDVSGNTHVKPPSMAGGNALKYIFRIELQGAIFTLGNEMTTEPVVQAYHDLLPFDKHDFCVFDNLVYRSLSGANTGNTPDSAPLFWAYDNGLDLTPLMQESNTGFYDEKYNGLVPKYSLLSILTPPSNEVDNSLDINYLLKIKNDSASFSTNTGINIHSLLKKNSSEFDEAYSTDVNTTYKSLRIFADGSTTPNVGGGISQAKATINGIDPTIIDLEFKIEANTYNDEFVLFVTPTELDAISLAAECGQSQSSGGAGLTNKEYLDYPDGAYTIDYNMLSASDSMIIYIMDILNPTERIIIGTTGGFVSNTGTVSFTFVASDAVGGDFFVEIQGGGAGTKWYYTLNCPSGGGSGTINTSFSEHNNVWISSYGIVNVQIDDLVFIGDCADFNFYFHHNEDNDKHGISYFKGFVNDFSLVKFKIQNSNPARTVIKEISLQIRTTTGEVLENVNIPFSSLDFQGKTNSTFQNNEKSDIEVIYNAGVYTGKYGFIVKNEWTNKTNLVFSVEFNATIKKTPTESFTKVISFTSEVFDLGTFSESKNTILEPIVLKHDDSVQFWTIDELTRLTAPLSVGITRVIGVFKEINLNDLQATIANLTGFLYCNDGSANTSSTHYFHDRALYPALPENPFSSIPMALAANIEIDGTDPTIVRIRANFDSSKASKYISDCYNIGARLDRIDPLPTPSEPAIYSLHFSGDLNGSHNTVYFDEKAQSLQIHNILAMAGAYTMKYKDTHALTDWTLEPPLTLAQIHSSISGGSDNYSLHFEITSYNVSYLNAVIVLEYISTGITPTFNYQSNNVLNQNIWFGVPNGYELNIVSFVSGNASVSNSHWGLKHSDAQDMTIYDETIPSINALLLGDVSEKMITLFIEYEGVNVTDTVTIETILT